MNKSILALSLVAILSGCNDDSSSSNDVQGQTIDDNMGIVPVPDNGIDPNIDSGMEVSPAPDDGMGINPTPAPDDNNGVVVIPDIGIDADIDDGMNLLPHPKPDDGMGVTPAPEDNNGLTPAPEIGELHPNIDDGMEVTPAPEDNNGLNPSPAPDIGELHPNNDEGANLLPMGHVKIAGANNVNYDTFYISGEQDEHKGGAWAWVETTGEGTLDSVTWDIRAETDSQYFVNIYLIDEGGTKVRIDYFPATNEYKQGNFTFGSKEEMLAEYGKWTVRQYTNFAPNYGFATGNFFLRLGDSNDSFEGQPFTINTFEVENTYVPLSK